MRHVTPSGPPPPPPRMREECYLLAKLSKRDAGCGKIKCIAGWSKKM
jgi:hypothetical protein